MKIEPKDIQVGDRITVSGRVSGVFPEGGTLVVFDGDTCDHALSVAEIAHAEIARPPQPPEVGDTIGLNGWDEEFRVVSLDDDGPWVVPSHRPSAVPVKVPRRGVRR